MKNPALHYSVSTQTLPPHYTITHNPQTSRNPTVKQTTKTTNNNLTVFLQLPVYNSPVPQMESLSILSMLEPGYTNSFFLKIYNKYS